MIPAGVTRKVCCNRETKGWVCEDWFVGADEAYLPVQFMRKYSSGWRSMRLWSCGERLAMDPEKPKKVVGLG